MSYKTIIDRARSTDRDKLTVNQRFCHSDFVTVISSQSEGLGKMGSGDSKICFRSLFSANGVIWFAVSLFVVSLLWSLLWTQCDSRKSTNAVNKTKIEIVLLNKDYFVLKSLTLCFEIPRIFHTNVRDT